MQRDVVLDIIIAKEIARHYMAACDIGQELLAKAEDEARAVAVRGLVRRYAAAVAKGDTETVARTSEVLRMVPLVKAMEIFNYATGQREVEIFRDRSGRFSRFLAGSTSSMAPNKRQGGRRPTEVAVAENVDTTRLEQGLQNNGQNPVQGAISAETAQQLAGRVRAVNRFQDELKSLFGDSQDIVVVLESQAAPGDTPQQATLGLAQPITRDAYDILETTTTNGGTPEMTYGLRSNADPKVREQFLMYNQMLDSGIPPHIAADLVQNPQSEQARNVQEALTGYAGPKPNKTIERLQRHVRAADALGGFFMNTGSPQLVAAGAAMKNAARVGGKIDENTLLMAERMNYRYRGRKDRLPREFSDAIRTRSRNPEDVTYSMLVESFDDPNLKQNWPARRQAVEAAAKRERELSLRRDGTGASMSDPFYAVVSHANRTISQKVSPRNYVDSVSRDLAITSLIREIPSDKRAVELSEKSGYGIPSSGIIIRSDGQAKEMYRGVADDHYLPFSARALPEMRDGQYVRTRTLGGLTPEDVTSAVVSGARSVSVVSGSGVFTVELRPDVSLVGRLGSPEVAAMGERYERLLDQVAASGIYMQDVSPQVKADLRSKAMNAVNSSDPKVWKPRFDNMLDRARRDEMTLKPDEIEAIKAAAAKDAPQGRSPQDSARILSELQEERLAVAQAEKVRAISLNAEGYQAALTALSMQYPGVISRTRYESLKDFTQTREMQPDIFEPAEIMLRSRVGSKDTGLAAPGENSAYARNKKWLTGTRADRPAAAAPAASASPVAGAAGAAAATGAARSSATPTGSNGVSMLTVQSKMSDALTKHREATAAVAVNTPDLVAASLASNVKTSFTTKADFDAALQPGGDALGPDTDFKSSEAVPARIIQSKQQLKHAAESSSGRGAAMALAFGDAGKWAGILDDTTQMALSGAKLKEAQTNLDLAVSSALLSSVATQTGPVDVKNTAAFVVQPDLFAAVDPDFTASGSEEVRDRVAAIAYDDSTNEGRLRKQGLSAIEAFAEDNGDYMDRISHDAHRANVGGEPMSSVSVLGLLALQAKMTADLNGLDWSNDAKQKQAAKMILAVTGESGFDSEQEFVAAKKATTLALQSAIGSQYLLRSLGSGGDVGPKAVSVRFEKADQDQQPTVHEQLDLLLLLVEQNPEEPSGSGHPLSKEHQTYRRQHLRGRLLQHR